MLINTEWQYSIKSDAVFKPESVVLSCEYLMVPTLRLAAIKLAFVVPPLGGRQARKDQLKPELQAVLAPNLGKL